MVDHVPEGRAPNATGDGNPVVAVLFASQLVVETASALDTETHSAFPPGHEKVGDTPDVTAMAKSPPEYNGPVSVAEWPLQAEKTARLAYSMMKRRIEAPDRVGDEVAGAALAFGIARSQLSLA